MKQIFSVDPDALGFGVTLSRDDRSIYYGVVSNDADIWLMSVE